MFLPSLMGFDKAGFIDPDYLAFYNRVVAAGGSLTATEQAATEQLVLDLKGYSIWSKMKAIYPMVGASAAACSQNLKSSSFTGTFTSGWTFANSGINGNGSNTYFNTTFQPNTLSGSGCWSIYTNNNGSNISQSRDIGYGNYTTREVGLGISYSGTGYGLHGSYSPLQYVTFSNNPVVLGFYISNNYSGVNKVFRNNSTIASATQSYTYEAYNMYIGAEYDFGTNNVATPSDRRYCFASLGDGLTDTEASNFYTAVQGFNTTLARQV